MKKYILNLFISIVFSVFFIQNYTFALTENITHIDITTSPQTINENEISSVITIQTRNSSDLSESLDTSGTKILLSTTSSTGEFSSSNSNWVPVTSLGMNKGWANRSFYYKDSTAGEYTITIQVEGTDFTVEQSIMIEPITVSVSGITVNSENNLQEIYVGDSLQMNVSILPENATNQEVVWNISDSDIADITKDGLLTGLSEGQVKVTAVSVDNENMIGEKIINIKNTGENNNGGSGEDTDKDITPPVIKLIGDELVYVLEGSNYVDLGASATDDIDLDISEKILTNNEVDTSKVGAYKVFYSVKDNALNESKTERTVIVKINPESEDVNLITEKSEDNYSIATIPTDTELLLNNNDLSVSVFLPAEINIYGPSDWDGKFSLPKISETLINPNEKDNKKVSNLSSIKIGLDDTHLTFDKPVKIVFKNKAGSLVGWSYDESFHEIENICDSESNPSIDEDSECKINSGGDLIVWTRHFTTFTTYVYYDKEEHSKVIGSTTYKDTKSNSLEIVNDKEKDSNNLVQPYTKNVPDNISVKEKTKKEIKEEFLPEINEKDNENISNSLVASAGFIKINKKWPIFAGLFIILVAGIFLIIKKYK